MKTSSQRPPASVPLPGGTDATRIGGANSRDAFSGKPTMRELAALAGCSPTTISLALRNHPRIAPGTRARIMELARNSGYSLDPVVSTLMNRLRSSRKRRDVEKLAMLTWWRTPGARQNPRGEVICDGICERARHLGYEVDEFWAREPRMTLARLSRILRARSIRGLILMSMPHARAHASLDWRHFAAAGVDHTLLRPELHHAGHDHSHGMILALRNLKRLGYTRVGYLNLAEQDDMNDNTWLSACMGYQYRSRPHDIIPPLLIPGWDLKAISAWIERYNIQAVVSNLHEVINLLKTIGLDVPGDIGFASLDCLPPGDTCAGVDILRDQVGAKTVDLVAEQLYNNELGLPRHPKTVFVKGVWRDGDSLKNRAGGKTSERENDAP